MYGVLDRIVICWCMVRHDVGVTCGGGCVVMLIVLCHIVHVLWYVVCVVVYCVRHTCVHTVMPQCVLYYVVLCYTPVWYVVAYRAFTYLAMSVCCVMLCYGDEL